MRILIGAVGRICAVFSSIQFTASGPVRSQRTWVLILWHKSEKNLKAESKYHQAKTKKRINRADRRTLVSQVFYPVFHIFPCLGNLVILVFSNSSSNRPNSVVLRKSKYLKEKYIIIFYNFVQSVKLILQYYPSEVTLIKIHNLSRYKFLRKKVLSFLFTQPKAYNYFFL